MKKSFSNIALLGKITQLKTRIKDYSLVAGTLEEFVMRQERFIDRVSWRSQLPPKLIKTLIHESTTIMTFATLLGFDIAGLKGAAIGSMIGGVIVIGNAVFRILFIRTARGIELGIVEV